MASQYIVKLSANFERNLATVEDYLVDVNAPQAFDALLEELLQTVVPNLERFPGMGRRVLTRQIRSVETGNGIDRLDILLRSLGRDVDLREYVMSHYLVLYARVDATVYLLSIRHHRQLSFDFQSQWPVNE